MGSFVIIGQVVSEEKMFEEIVDDGRTTTDSPLSQQLTIEHFGSGELINDKFIDKVKVFMTKSKYKKGHYSANIVDIVM